MQALGSVSAMAEYEPGLRWREQTRNASSEIQSPAAGVINQLPSVSCGGQGNGASSSAVSQFSVDHHKRRNSISAMAEHEPRLRCSVRNLSNGRLPPVQGY
ncbi:hypothetical protein KC19_4G035100 [Ceratodon purpureus]|uniref:Uncharacterized protein n=1 Tax=Ceratodon purpureus TaxID=3225 RepID=A0A8T0I642_CERPU|nr:hypothetical protein KC19_4G035100 [Ceratodon purpureus]